MVCTVVSQTQLNPTQFLQAVLTEFGFKPFKKRKVELLDMLNMFLIEQYSNGKKVVLIVDEAHNLRDKALEEIRLLSGIETHKEKVLRIILAGQPELRDTLEKPGMKQLVQRVRLKFHIGPLSQREMAEYIEHRVSVAGRDGDTLFDKKTYDVIYRFTGGVPRIINTLCDTALLCAFADDRESVDLSDIESAIEELGLDEHELTTGRYRQLEQGDQIAEKSVYLTKIEVRNEGKTVSEHHFGAGRIIAGRSPDNEIYIKSKYVRRHHAQLISDDDGCVVEDLNSTNGVLIGTDRVKKYRLHDGDVMSMGVHELVYTDLRRADTESVPELGADDEKEEETHANEK